jgi:hypothetical protein
MQSIKSPDLLFQFVSMDLMEIDDKDRKRQHYLITVDHYSEYFEIDLMEDQKSNTVVGIKPFATHGILETVICDNGVQFNSAKFSACATAYKFNISYKEGNGKAKAAVKIAKALIFKSIDDGTDINLALLNLRSAPNKTGASPTQSFSRRTTCMILVSFELLKRQIVRDVKEIIIDNNSRAKFYHDPKCMKEKTFHLGEQIFAKLTDRQKNWLLGFVVNKTKSRSYDVSVNSRYLLPKLVSQ